MVHSAAGIRNLPWSWGGSMYCGGATVRRASKDKLRKIPLFCGLFTSAVWGFKYNARDIARVPVRPSRPPCVHTSISILANCGHNQGMCERWALSFAVTPIFTSRCPYLFGGTRRRNLHDSGAVYSVTGLFAPTTELPRLSPAQGVFRFCTHAFSGYFNPLAISR